VNSRNRTQFEPVVLENLQSILHLVVVLVDDAVGFKISEVRKVRSRDELAETGSGGVRIRVAVRIGPESFK